MGVVHRTNPALIESILSDLIDDYENNSPKPTIVWAQDLLFAAETGDDLDWNYLKIQRVNVNRLQRDLQRSLSRILKLSKDELSSDYRERLTIYLGMLEDPRLPITIERRGFQGNKSIEPIYHISSAYIRNK